PSPEQQVAALVAPVRKTEPVEPPRDEPVERVPQAARPKAPPVMRTSSERKLRPGDLICGACGEGNLPTRKFCGRCGESLATAEVVRTPWWRKLFRRRGPKVVKASKHGRKRSTFGVGDALRRVYRVGRIVVGVAIIIGGVVYAAYPPFRTMINSEITGVKQSVTKKVDTAFVPVHAAKVVASTQKKGHAGSLAVDEVVNTYWLAPAGTGQFPSLTLTFQHPETLERMIVHSGVANDYTGHGRPSQLVLIYSNQESESLDLQDTAKPQTVNISHALRVSSIRIEVASTYSGGKPPDVAISEIELFALP
ncbi:MAG TPA: zinc ribbon domain-containing protein, partial [Pseudonocardiaceae bacterium]|nr:zinc ribbon domain-containing protein [Pseudonocardiaceae bacterium]